MKSNVLRALLALWLLPITLLIWTLYLLPITALGWIRIDGMAGFMVVRFCVTDKNAWFKAKWKPWGGRAWPHAIVINRETRTIVPHELRHTDQWLLLGPFFLPIYGILYLKHGYYDNPLEADARDNKDLEEG